MEHGPIYDLRLVKANPMGQDLNCGIGAVVTGRHTELGADVICSDGCIVSGKNNVGEVSPLLGHVQNEVCGLEVGLRDSKVEDSLSSCQVDWHSGVDASLCGSRSCQHCQHCDCRKIHCERLERRIYL
jgi:hypothetical protein